MTNFEMFNSLLSVFLSPLILSREQDKSPFDKSPSIAAQSLRASAPSSERMSCGSIMLPNDFDIFFPLSSRMCWWIQVSLNGALEVSRYPLRIV